MRERRVLLPERLHLAADLPHGHTEIVELALEVAPLRFGALGRGQSPQLSLDMCGRSLGVERVQPTARYTAEPCRRRLSAPRLHLRGEAIRCLARAPSVQTWAIGTRSEEHTSELQSREK